MTIMPRTTPARPLTEVAKAAFAARLAQHKGRNDLEILAVTGVEPRHLHGRFSSTPGLAFTVEFTYTTGRRQHRTADVAWALTDGSCLEDHPGVPAPVWELLNNALTAAPD